ncbi:hypothetical protein LEMA_P045530.1 [Plenodomus lingam JN3]|uniref:DUF1857-domain-containing protein n=2 Tax=Leptosphaeria maculans TaxID=5022 RepID=E5R479_LEPMJ|nr:hypothetical protein LEMA_P045530.1 [Plenodomus lingam JN3]CBX91847.1 hypothetical protein LEMA_P045530.1 [Plenodomus lingam JN3]
MVTFHLSHTSPINPPSAAPVLTQAQLWAGLQRKIRFAQEFVPVIEGCEVLGEEAGEGGDVVVTREVRFKAGAGPRERAREVVRGFWPCWIDFEQQDGSHIRNIISTGSSGSPTDLYMTYTFEFKFPDLQRGSDEAHRQLGKLKEMAQKAVDMSIDAIRAMVLDGRITV